MNTTTVEIVCVGSFSNNYIHESCRINSIEVTIDHLGKEIRLDEYPSLPIVEFTRKDRVNYCKFEILDDAFGWYRRPIQTKPYKVEKKWFKVENGNLIVLGDLPKPHFQGILDDFYSEYKNIYRIHYYSSRRMITSSPSKWVRT
jgi:hypothetical protein